MLGCVWLVRTGLYFRKWKVVHAGDAGFTLNNPESGEYFLGSHDDWCNSVQKRLSFHRPQVLEDLTGVYGARNCQVV